jgi:hypothetical protein
VQRKLAMSERLLDLLKRALPTLRKSKDMARSGESIRERAKLVREVEVAIAQGDSVDLELSAFVNEAAKKEDPLEAVETLFNESKRRFEGGERDTPGLMVLRAYMNARLPSLFVEVRRLRTKSKPKKNARRNTRVAIGTCSACGSKNEFCIKAKADLSDVEADCINYIASHIEENDDKRAPLVQDSIDYGMAIDALIREHAMHVVWGGELEAEVKRLAENSKSPKVKKALEKLAEQIKGAKPARKTTNEDDGRFE